MLSRSAALIAAALMLAAAGPKPAAKAPPASRPKPAAGAQAAASGFDARNPGSLIELMAGLDARAEIVRTEGDGVMLKVTSPAGGFVAQYGGCDAHGRACAAVQFDASAEARTATLAELNRFNLSSLTCRMVQDSAGKPHVLYSALVQAGESRQAMLADVNAWRGCIGDFGAFLKDPTGYLASAP